eukprot:gene981-biopygen234
MAMASWTANIPQLHGSGPPVITIHGSAYHRTGSQAPQSSSTEIAAIYNTKDGAASDPNDRIVHIQRPDGYLIDIKATNPAADPLTYPLLFPFCEHGWGTAIAKLPAVHAQIPADQPERRQTRLTASQFYTYRIQVQEHFSALHLSRPLFQQYLVDAFTKVEGSDLTYIRTHQKDLRVESYKGLMDHLYRRAEHQNLLAQAHNPATAQHSNVGRVIILPSSFTGSQRSMQQNYQDAMTIVRTHAKPDIVLTFTANPSWQEILENLLPNQKPQDRPDIVTRVLNLKFKELLCDILDLNFFGKVIAYVYTVEFQKRGLPHTHMILSLAEQDKPRTLKHIDRRDQNTHTREHHIVKKHMMHGPCGILNPSCICMQDGKCTKKFPKDLAQQTELNVNGYPLYRRRGKTTAQLQQHRVNDSWLVPHNIKLLLKFDCLINAEVCTTIKSVKYIFKYIHKGNDMAHVEIREGHQEPDAHHDIVHDEIRQYLNSRYVGPHQAMYKLMRYEMYDKSHTIVRLAIHLPDQQAVYFTDPDQAAHRNNDSMLMAYFTLN